MAESDNTGIPASYCLLSTASSIAAHKRTKALAAWCQTLRDDYGINPRFVHVDKDMAEIGCIRMVWPRAKIQLCWWHLRKAVRERLAKNKLSTTPYKPSIAHAEFPFIDPTFKPSGKSDSSDYEGGQDEYADRLQVNTGVIQGPNTLTIRLPPTQNFIPAITTPSSSRSTSPVDDDSTPASQLVPSAGEDLVLTVQAREQRIFCPDEYKGEIVNMMERHLCAHPLIPGFSHPSPDGIREWAVRQMYLYCERYDLSEVWAYLYQNWYRKGRWSLWARSACPEEIPILKTTMMVESQ